MKNCNWLAVLVAGLSWNAAATLFTYNWTEINVGIPDAVPSGYVNHQTITDDLQGNYLPNHAAINSPSLMALNINLSRGWNGDLYGYVRYEDGGGGVGFTVLLNRVGAGVGNPIGYTTAGMDITRFDSASDTDIQTVPTPTTSGTYRVDQTGSGTSFVSSEGLNPTTGTWSLFLADRSGNHVSTLAGWWALGIFGVLAAGVGVARQWRIGNVSAADENP